MGTRRKARENALKVLYAMEVGKNTAQQALESFWNYFEEADDGSVFTDMLVLGTEQHIDDIDQAIQGVSTHWKIHRMAYVDRNILRMAAFELFHVEEIPKRVTLNEAIEIAKRFGAGDSWAFINGILDKLAQDGQ